MARASGSCVALADLPAAIVARRAGVLDQILGTHLGCDF